jgi:hypothetical protein
MVLGILDSGSSAKSTVLPDLSDLARAHHGQIQVRLTASWEDFVRTIFAGLLYFFICALTCSPMLAQAPPPTFLFLLEGRGVPTGTVHVFRVNTSTGGITEVPGSPFNAGLLPNQLTVDPTGRFVYVINQQSQDITTFGVDPLTGALTQLPGSPVLIGTQPITAAPDPTGRFFYVFATTNVNGLEQELLYEYTIALLKVPFLLLVLR